MKTYIVLFISIFGSHLFGQDRLVSKVYFPSGKETIEGILIRPNNHKNTPAVVFQQGSGNHSFKGYETEAWGPHKFYIEDVLLEQGYAVLYCNKRGLGKSTGNWRKNDFYGRAEDAYAAVAYLKTLDFIDTTRIGVSGHSQGGWIAQIVAAQHQDIAFIICLAGPTVGVTQQMDHFNERMLECQGLEGEKLDRKVEKKKRSSRTSVKIGKIMPFIGSAHHWYLIHDYDNDEVLKSIQCPALYLFAEHDINVPPDENIEHFDKVFDHNPPDNFEIKVMPGGQHGFYQVPDQCVDWDTATQQPFDPLFQDEIRKWLKALD